MSKLANSLIGRGDDPILIRVGGDKLAACRTITQNVLVLEDKDKFTKLKEALVKIGCHQRGNRHKCLIFCRTKANVDALVYQLQHECSFEVYGLHSDKTQDERLWTLDQFKNGELSCLAGTNILGRGHDIPRVRYVLNYDCPDNIENYIHRIGRTGRAGETGFAMTFLTEKDSKLAGPLIEVLRETAQKIPDGIAELAAQDWGTQPSWQ